jgi:AP2 domain
LDENRALRMGKRRNMETGGDETMAVIEIGGYRVLVDDEDLDRILLHSWEPMKSDSRIYFKTPKRTSPRLYLHRMIMNAKDGQEVDHKNADWLDNRKASLRFCSQSQNNFNQRISRRNTSGIKGVSWSLVSQKWRAYINTGGRQSHLGLFDDLQEAGNAYREAAQRIAKEFARS